jgi:hypothetical protein
MDANECKQEQFSSRTIGLAFLVVSLFLVVVGLIVLPVVGIIFAFPLILLGIMMVAAPESKACRMLRRGFRAG